MKVEVCFLCDRRIGPDGAADVPVEAMEQVHLLLKKQLKSSICCVCFREHYDRIREELRHYVKLLKKETLVKE